MIADIEDTKLDDFDIDKAQRLLESIRYMADIRKFPVQKPGSASMEMFTMKEWVQWYAAKTEWNGTTGTETEVMRVIQNLNEDLKLLSSRVEEGFQRLLTVLDRRDLKIKMLNTQNTNLSAEVMMLKDKLRDLSGKTKTEIPEENIDEQEDKSEEEEETPVTIKKTKVIKNNETNTVIDLGLAPAKKK